MIVDRKWIEEEREGWKRIARSMAPDPVREHARIISELLDEVIELRRRVGE